MSTIKTDTQAWKFLTQVVRPHGEFRIHTNKRGLKVYVSFTYPKLTGWTRDYLLIGWGPAMYHRDLYRVLPRWYGGSVVANTLKEAVALHVADFPGEVEHDRMKNDKFYRSSELSKADFIAKYVASEGPEYKARLANGTIDDPADFDKRVVL